MSPASTVPDEGLSGRRIGALALVLAVVLATVPAPVAGVETGDIGSVELIDRVDRDGDGRISAVRVRITANTDMNDGFLAGDPEPYFEVHFHRADGSYVEGTEYSQGVGNRNGVFVLELPVARMAERNPDLREEEVAEVWVDLMESEPKTDYWAHQTMQSVEPFRIETAAADRLIDLRVESNVEGAVVELDGERLGTAPATTEVPADRGLTTLTVRADGYEPATDRVLLTSGVGDVVTRQVDLQPQSKPLVVESEPTGAAVSVDGRRVGTTPFAAEYRIDRSYRVEVRTPGYEPATFTGVRPGTPVVATLAREGDGGGGGGTGATNLTLSPIPIDPDRLLVPVLPELDLRIVAARPSLSTNETRVGEPVTFDGTGSYSLAGDLAGYEWTFGDGSSATGATATHAFDAGGTYEATLTVTDENGSTASATRTVTVVDEAPVARFGVRGEPAAGRPVTLDATGSTDREGAIAAYEWTFPDGVTRSGERVEHLFAGTGDHEVTLRVVDAAGNANATTRTVTVVAPNAPPEPRLAVTPPPVVAGTAVTFDASGTVDADGRITAYGWSLGDGSFAAGERVEHTYARPGTYDVELVVQDDEGTRARLTETIEVRAATTATATPAPTPTPVDTDAGSDDGERGDGTGDGSGADGGTERGSGFPVPGFGLPATIAAVVLAAALRSRLGRSRRE